MSIYKSAATLPYGSIVVTISAVTYIAESWEPRSPVSIVERKNENNEPNGFVQVDEARTVQAVLQLATASTAVPARGTEFTVGGITYVVGETSEPKAQGEMWKFNLQAREKI